MGICLVGYVTDHLFTGVFHGFRAGLCQVGLNNNKTKYEAFEFSNEIFHTLGLNSPR